MPPAASRLSRCGTAIPAGRAQTLGRFRARRPGSDCRRKCRASCTRTRRTVTAALSSWSIPQCGLACADDIEELIRTCTTGEIAAFLAETIIGSGGFIVPPPGYFERAAAIARKYGGLFICRRSANRLGTHRRQVVRHRALERRARHDHQRQGHGQRRAGGRDDRHARSGRQVSGHHVCNVRRQPGVDGRGAGHACR